MLDILCLLSFLRTSAPRVGGTAAGEDIYVPFFPQGGFGFSYAAVLYLAFLRGLIFCDGEYYNQAYSDVLMAGLQ